MRSPPAHTRTRTLQERLGTHQNGSTGVRSTGRHAEEPHPVHRHDGVEEVEENDYFHELRSPEIITNHVFCDNGCDLDYYIDADKVPVTTSPSAERQFGDSGNKEFKACEERRSSASKIDTHGKFESRSLQAMPVNGVVNENEPTPPVLPKLYRLNGQTGHLQAEQAEQAEEFEKESEFECWTDNLSHEMKAVRNFMSMIGAMHAKKIEAMHIDNIFPEFRQGGLPVPVVSSLPQKVPHDDRPVARREHPLSTPRHVL